MDRSDLPLYAAADPPTVKTEPPKPAAAEPPAATLPAAEPPVEAQDRPRPLLADFLADWDRERIKSVGVRAAKVAAIAFSAWFTVVIFLIAVYRFVNPPFSSLMAMQWVTGTSIHRQWVPIEEISPNLVRAVIASEDGRFCEHWGIDFAEIAAAIQRTSGGVPRGASTITMQVAKNLFLWPAKSYVRKLVEVPLTYAIELMWTKRRILEVYLNIAEWGPGVFGAEAAARAHFGRSARGLSARQAAQLAVALPNPFQRDAGDPGPWTARRASVIQARAARSPEASSCVLGDD
jgi:monofunctional biosynthetic peptidoglycan transglycosylase